MRNYRVAMLCAEENPAECHRHLLVGRVLAERGIELLHIRGDGHVETNEQLIEQSRGADDRQQLLFAELKERPWRSSRSVVRNSPQPS